MSVQLVHGIVLRYTNYRENDRILTILSPERGRIDVKSRGCRRPKSKLLSCSETFVYGQFELFESKGRLTLDACTVLESFFPIREDIARFALGASVLQFSNEVAQENEPNEELFLLLYRTLSFLAYGEVEPMDLFCCFLIKFLSIAGFSPRITHCASCGRDVRKDDRLYFGARTGGVTCSACMRGEMPISKTALEAMRRMLLLPDDEMHRVSLKPPLRKEIFTCLTDYASYTLEYGSRALNLIQQLPQ